MKHAQGENSQRSRSQGHATQ